MVVSGQYHGMLLVMAELWNKGLDSLGAQPKMFISLDHTPLWLPSQVAGADWSLPICSDMIMATPGEIIASVPHGISLVLQFDKADSGVGDTNLGLTGT